jgi:hypothetical protein
LCGYGKGGGRRRGVADIMMISPKTILTTAEDHRSLSHHHFGFIFFFLDIA